jgi:catechol 2,3-dioxygenase-like lactoylglutathione lyase family enzyme
MLGDNEAFATVAVRDMGVAREFYEKTLGLTIAEEPGEEVMEFKTGAGKLFVYQSTFAGTNRATGVTWPMSRPIDDMVRALASKGVRFEHYDIPELHLEGDVHVHGSMRVAWFEDPDGNIHTLVSG